MKLLLRLVASILLMSVRADCWPYREIVDTGKSGPVYISPLYEAAPELSLFPIEAVKEVGTVVAGPVTAITIIEGSSSGPVTILTSGSPDGTLQNTSSLIRETTDAVAAPEDSVIIKGASAGQVTLIAPSGNSASVGNVNDTAPGDIETKKDVNLATPEAVIVVENSEESSTTKESMNATVIRETIGTVSANAVIGPSIGPIIIAGPTAPPVPITPATSTLEPETTASSPVTSPVSVTFSAVANGSIANTTTDYPVEDKPGHLQGDKFS